MFQPGQIISHMEMSQEEHVHLQKGMNFNLGTHYSVILMSLRPNAPYADAVKEDGRVLIYEGHDHPKLKGIRDPKALDQPMNHNGGTLTENGKFYEAAKNHKDLAKPPHLVRVYEKLFSGVWVYNGLFKLIDAWRETSDARKVFKFRLELTDQDVKSRKLPQKDLDHNRMIPSAVKLAVWKRDGGKCTKCGSTDNLHFDHILPFSKGGTSLLSDNIQLLCARHNLEKHDRIE